MKAETASMILLLVTLTVATVIVILTPFGNDLLEPELGPLESSNEIPDTVCVIENGKCVQDITEEYKSVSTDRGRECGAFDLYYETGRYICVKSIYDTNNSIYRERGADKIVETYFTEVDGNTYIWKSTEVTGLKANHLYSTTSLIQAGYCHGPSKLIRVTELNASCDGGSDCHGIPMGWVNGTRVEACV